MSWFLRWFAVLLWISLLAGTPAFAQDWPGGKWGEKLAAPYEQWKPVKDVLAEFAQGAGVKDVAFEAEQRLTSAPLMVPLPAGLTLKEAFQRAAAVCALEPSWQGGKLVVRRSNRIGAWLELVGGEGQVVALGETRGSLYLPRGKKGPGPTPWVWYAPSGLGPMHAWLAKRLFAEGVALAVVGVGESHGNPKGRAVFTEFYEKLVKDYGVARKAVLLPQSRGGLMLYNWAAEHPDCVAGVGGIYTVCDLRSYPGLKQAATAYGMTPEELEAQLANHNPIDRLAPLAKARIPIFHVHGDKDGAVPLEKNAGELVRRYRALGGEAQLLVIPGGSHEVSAAFFQCKELADFLVRQAKAAAAPSAPAPDRKGAGDK